MQSIGKTEMLETLPELVDPRHTALLVYDAIKQIAFGGSALGAYPTDAGHGGHLSSVTDMLPRWASLVAAARRVGVPVIYTRHVWNESDGVEPPTGPWLRYVSRRGLSSLSDFPLPENDGVAKPWDSSIIDELTPHPEDRVLAKARNNAFEGTQLEEFLRAQGVKTVIVTGISTESGIEANCRMLLSKGFYAVLPTDCVNSSEPELHNAALTYLDRSATAELTVVDDIISIWTA
jgi:nicotinamidase-related amidase